MMKTNNDDYEWINYNNIIISCIPLFIIIHSLMKYKYTIMIMCAIHIKGIQYQEWLSVTDLLSAVC